MALSHGDVFSYSKLTNSEKITVFMVSFEGVALNWYRWKEQREPFQDWKDLKLRLLNRFRSLREGTLTGQFSRIQQVLTTEEHCTRFEKLMTLVSHLTDEVLLETFMTRLYPVIRAKLECWENMKLDVVIKKAQWIKNKEVAWRKRRKRKREEARPNKKTLSPIAHQ